MARRKKLYFAGLILLNIAGPVIAQHGSTPQDTLYLSLEEAWEKADLHSRLIEIKSTQTHIAATEIKEALLERFPEIGFKGTAEKATNIPIYENGLFNKPTQHEIIHTLYKVGLDAYFNIYNGNKLNLKIEEVKTAHKLAGIEEAEAISNIHYKTASLYLDLQKSFIFKSLIEEDIKDQEKQLKEIQSFYKNGTVLKSDVLRVELDLSKRKMALITIENDIQIAAQKLNIILGEPDDRPVNPTIFKETWDKSTLYPQHLTTALAHSFPLHISHQRTLLSDINLKTTRANTRPSIGIYSDFYYANPQIFLFPYNPYWYSLGVVGVKATFPISSIYHNIHKVRAARLELEKEEEMHRDVEDQLRQQVREAHLRFEESLDQIKVAEVNVTQARENARIIKNTYFNHTSLITDLLDANIQLLQTQFELAAARISAQDKYYLLQNITGIL